MNNNLFNRIRAKIGWIIKKRKLKSCGEGCRVGIDLVLRGSKYISIGNQLSAGKNLTIETWEEYNGNPTGIIPKFEIGSNVSIMDDCQFSCARCITIGDGVLMGNNVFITDNFHGSSEKKELIIPPADRELYIKGEVHIQDNVWIGRNVCIMPGVTIGEGSVVGANSVVTKNVEPFSIVVGAPARKIVTKLKM